MNIQESPKEKLVLITVIAGVVLMHSLDANKKDKLNRGSTKQKREQYKNTLPFLNPISYEKPMKL